MLVSVAEVQAEMNDLFDQRARQIARDTGFCRRQRELTGPVFAKTLVFGLMLKPDSTLEDLQDFASEHQGVNVTAKAFGERFGEASAGFLEALLAEALGRCFTARASLLPVLRRFNGVYLRDASTVSLPACLADFFPARAAGNGKPAAAVKVVLEMELATGQFTELQVVPALDNDKTSLVAAKPLPEGSLLLEDMGFRRGSKSGNKGVAKEPGTP